MTSRIYLDYNATTPIADEVAAEMSRVLSEPFGNPSSLHWAGIPARDAIETARSQVAGLLTCDATEVVFTSGGTEASNQVIKGLFFRRPASDHPFHIVTSRIEHPAVLEPCNFLEKLGAVRFSLGRDTTRDEIDCVVESIVDAIKRSTAAM